MDPEKSDTVSDVHEAETYLQDFQLEASVVCNRKADLRKFFLLNLDWLLFSFCSHFGIWHHDTASL